MERNIVGNLDVLLSLEDHGPYYRIKRSVQSKLFMLETFTPFTFAPFNVYKLYLHLR